MVRRLPRGVLEAGARQPSGKGPLSPIILTALGAGVIGGVAGAKLVAKLHSKDIASQITSANTHVSAVASQSPSLATLQDANRALGKLEALGGVLPPNPLARDLRRKWRTALQRAQRVTAYHQRWFLEQLANAPGTNNALRQQGREQLHRSQFRPPRQRRP